MDSLPKSLENSPIFFFLRSLIVQIDEMLFHSYKLLNSGSPLKMFILNFYTFLSRRCGNLIKLEILPDKTFGLIDTRQTFDRIALSL